MDILLRGNFLGATLRTNTKDPNNIKRYCDVHLAVDMRQAEGAVGQSSYQLRADPAIFAKARVIPAYAKVLVTCEENEYTREGGAVETVKIAVAIEVVAQQKAA